MTVGVDVMGIFGILLVIAIGAFIGAVLGTIKNWSMRAKKGTVKV